MNDLLLILAWGAGVASFLLVADMIKTDIDCRRGERGFFRHDRFGREPPG